MIALVGERQYVSLADLLPDSAIPFIVMLDGIEDPYNFGFTIRALYAAGVHGIVLRPRNWTSASAVVGRASAGTVERMPLAIADKAQKTRRNSVESAACWWLPRPSPGQVRRIIRRRFDESAVCFGRRRKTRRDPVLP